MKRALLLLAACPTLAHANFDRFIDDSKITTTFRMDYIDLHSDGFGTEASGFPDYDMGTWAQSAKVSYQSGYFSEHFGIDVEAYAVDPIGNQGEGFATREIVRANNDGDPVGFVKLPQYYLKQKFSIGDTSIELFQGRRVLFEYGGTSVENNAAMSSYNSLSSEIKNDNWFVKLAYIKEYSDSDEIDNAKLTTAEGDTIDYILTADFNYTKGNNEYRYYITESEGYMIKHQVRLARKFGPNSYLPPSKITATATYEKGYSNYKNMTANSRYFDDYAAIYEIGAEFFLDKGYMKFAYNYSDSDKEEGLGKFSLNMANNVQGSQDSLTSGNAWDYANNKEHAFMIAYFKDVGEDFTLGVDARGGFFKYQGDTITEGEVSLVSLWHPKKMPNLSVSFVVARDQSFKRDYFNTPYMVDGKFRRSNGHAYVSTIKYSF